MLWWGRGSPLMPLFSCTLCSCRHCSLWSFMYACCYHFLGQGGIGWMRMNLQGWSSRAEMGCKPPDCHHQMGTWRGAQSTAAIMVGKGGFFFVCNRAMGEYTGRWGGYIFLKGLGNREEVRPVKYIYYMIISLMLLDERERKDAPLELPLIQELILLYMEFLIEYYEYSFDYLITITNQFMINAHT